MKKINAEIQFVSTQLLKGPKGHMYYPLEARDSQMVKTVKVTVNLEHLPKTQDVLTLLTESQITAVFEEECGELFEAVEEVRSAFTFRARRHRGWMDRTAEGRTYHPNMFWVALVCDQGSKRVEDAGAQSSFILSQLVRFGVMDKLRLAPKE